MNEEDPIKIEGAMVATTLYIDISDAQEQLTPKSYARPRYLNEDPIKNDGARLVTIFSRL